MFLEKTLKWVGGRFRLVGYFIPWDNQVGGNPNQLDLVTCN